ncbi:efflux RND transporter permease subunit [Candidatus Margulisiibacteriota bacterium]
MHKKSFFLTEFAIRNRTSFFVALFIIILVGVLSYIAIPKEDFPDIDFPYIIVSSFYPGVSPADIETLATKPIEKQLKTLNDLKTSTSVSSESFSMIFLEFNPGIDIDNALQKVRDKVSLSKPDLPEDMEEPVIEEISFDKFPVMIINLSGSLNLVELKDLAEKLQDKLDVVPGVLDATIIGGYEKEIKVLVDLFKLNHYKLALSDIVGSIRGENINIPGGTIKVGDAKYLIRVPGEFESADEIPHLVLKTSDNKLIYVKDLADTIYGYKEQTSISRLNKENSVSLVITRRSGANLIKLSENVRKVLEKETPKFPQGVNLKVTGDRAESIIDMVNELVNSIITGMLLVAFVLLFFLGKRNAAFVAIAIPLSMFMSFILLRYLGMTLNMVVLFSLILALGMLVDNGIVIVENIFRHKQLGKLSKDASNIGTAEVALPVISSTATTIAAFIPLLFWPGIMGEFMKFLPQTLIIALISSLFVALCISPILCATFFPDKKTNGEMNENKIDQLKNKIKSKAAIVIFYEKILRSLIVKEPNKPLISKRLFINGAFFISIIFFIMLFNRFDPQINYAYSLGFKDSLIKIFDNFGISIFLSILGIGIITFVFSSLKGIKFSNKVFMAILIVLLFTLALLSLPFLDAPAGKFNIPAGFIRLLAGFIVIIPLLKFISYFDKYSPAYLKRCLLIHSFIILFFASIQAIPKLDILLMPKFTPERIVVKIEMAEGTLLEKTNEVAVKVEGVIEKLMAQKPHNIKHFVVNLGKSGDVFSGGKEASHYGEVNIDFYKTEKRKEFAKKYNVSLASLSPYKTIEELRKKTKIISGGKITVVEEDHGPPTGKDVLIEITGDDLSKLNSISMQIKSLIKNVGGIVNLEDNLKKGGPEMQIKIDRNKAALLGVNTFGVASNIRTAIHGTEATTYKEKDEEIDIVVQLKDRQKYSYNLLRYITIPGKDDKRIPLSQFATFSTRSGFGSITRIDFNRVVNIEADVSKESGRTPTAVINEIKNLLAKSNLVLPVGYTLKFRGKQEEQAKSSKFIFESFMIAIFLIAIILISQFNSIIIPSIVLFSVLLSFIGVVLGLFISPALFRQDFHLSSFVVIMTGVGVVSLAGVVVNNAIVLLDYIGRLRETGLEKAEAIIQAGLTRFRPVMLTAVTTILGLIPMSTGISLNFTDRFFGFIPKLIIGSDSSQWWSPLSDAVIFGLAVATILTLVMVPVFYFIFEDIHNKIFKQMFHKKLYNNNNNEKLLDNGKSSS